MITDFLPPNRCKVYQYTQCECLTAWIDPCVENHAPAEEGCNTDLLATIQGIPTILWYIQRTHALIYLHVASSHGCESGGLGTRLPARMYVCNATEEQATYGAVMGYYNFCYWLLQAMEKNLASTSAVWSAQFQFSLIHSLNPPPAFCHLSGRQTQS